MNCSPDCFCLLVRCFAATSYSTWYSTTVGSPAAARPPAAPHRHRIASHRSVAHRTSLHRAHSSRAQHVEPQQQKSSIAGATSARLSAPVFAGLLTRDRESLSIPPLPVPLLWPLHSPSRSRRGSAERLAASASLCLGDHERKRTPPFRLSDPSKRLRPPSHRTCCMRRLHTRLHSPGPSLLHLVTAAASLSPSLPSLLPPTSTHTRRRAETAN